MTPNPQRNKNPFASFPSETEDLFSVEKKHQETFIARQLHDRRSLA
jgi:hypothetical protein